jgi:acyl-CoA thioesterase FadM
MIFRTLLRILISRFGRRLGQYDVGRSRFRVLPTDLDVLGHMNNGVYFSIFDVARFDVYHRNGVWPAMQRRGWYTVAASETITFRKSLQPWQRFTIETRTIGFDERAIYVEHRAVVTRAGAPEVYARAFIKLRLLKRGGGTLKTAELFEAIGEPPALPPLPEWLLRWGADVALPPTRAEAPSVWE